MGLSSMTPVPREDELTLMPSSRSRLAVGQLLELPSVAKLAPLYMTGVGCAECEGVLVREEEVEVGVGGVPQSWAGPGELA